MLPVGVMEHRAACAFLRAISKTFATSSFSHHMLDWALFVLLQPLVAFPAVLERLQLHAFDLCKIIDPFVRYEQSMPRDLRRHLFSIEERILEALAWEKGSSFYQVLKMACGEVQPAPQAAADPTAASPQQAPADGEHAGSCAIITLC